MRSTAVTERMGLQTVTGHFIVACRDVPPGRRQRGRIEASLDTHRATTSLAGRRPWLPAFFSLSPQPPPSSFSAPLRPIRTTRRPDCSQPVQEEPGPASRRAPRGGRRQRLVLPGSAGAGADKVFGLIMCYADYNATACLDCLSRAPASITTVCPGSRNVRAMYDACVLRYSATPIPATADLSVLYPRGHDRPRAWGPLMSKLTDGVASSLLRLANSSTPYPSWQEMDGLAHARAASKATQTGWGELFPGNNTGGAIKGYSCYLRYQVGALEITLPPTTPAPPSPQPPSEELNSSRKLESLKRETSSTMTQIWKTSSRKGPDQRFRHGELAIATDNFSENYKLGEGGFGSVYRGFLQEINLDVAIKRVSKGSKQGRKEYASEVRIISRLRHRNLVQLIGWCHGGGELLLVYELMPNGSLDTHLYSGGVLLPWPLRHEIVLGLGSALLYLHQEDIKPSNVMLDASFHAKLGDFGLARLVDHGRGSHTTELAGTMGYMDPECMMAGQASTNSDVYSFGVVLLEIASLHEEEDVIHIVQWLWEFYGRGDIHGAADQRLNGEFDAGEMESLRPSVRQAVNVLRREAPLPSMPARMPVATYLSPPDAFYHTTSSGGGGTDNTPSNTTEASTLLE
ncbi:hypothetical protein HU200_041419 [Digitaria exilis]|uniref:Uncharacterized protein n=1 Tax=Digitaria exilis TaxID=1010633 RepID=A0A835B7J0_9POAL|nr:hypothetical protein HU200_041419 [Digitaria exilis]